MRQQIWPHVSKTKMAAEHIQTGGLDCGVVTVSHLPTLGSNDLAAGTKLFELDQDDVPRGWIDTGAECNVRRIIWVTLAVSNSEPASRQPSTNRLLVRRVDRTRRHRRVQNDRLECVWQRQCIRLSKADRWKAWLPLACIKRDATTVNP